eukprot:6097519-Prorocentrum_lima.AAC.1
MVDLRQYISMRAHFIHDMLERNLITIEYIPSLENAADALAKGLTTIVHRKAMRLLCLLDMEQ